MATPPALDTDYASAEEETWVHRAEGGLGASQAFVSKSGCLKVKWTEVKDGLHFLQ